LAAIPNWTWFHLEFLADGTWVVAPQKVRPAGTPATRTGQSKVEAISRAAVLSEDKAGLIATVLAPSFAGKDLA
jgi:hypothetical protein